MALDMVKGAAKGWVDFDGGAGSLSPRTSYNVASLDDNGAGDYSVNWTTSFSTSTYAAVASAGMGGSYYSTIVGGFGNGGYDASEVRIQVTDGNSSFAVVDTNVVNVVAFGSL